MRLRLILAALPCLAAIAVAAQAQDYPFDLAKSNPKAIAAWRSVVPQDLRASAWISRLDGTASPMEQVKIGGRGYYLGSVCKPHDCGGNAVAFLIARDGAAAAGLVESDTLGVHGRGFGALSPERLDLLKKRLAH